MRLPKQCVVKSASCAVLCILLMLPLGYVRTETEIHFRRGRRGIAAALRLNKALDVGCVNTSEEGTAAE